MASKPSKFVAAVFGIVCGAEVIIAIVIGGAGLGALFGWNGLALAAAALVLGAGLLHRHRRSKGSERYEARSESMA